jgi:hypothetical protein
MFDMETPLDEVLLELEALDFSQAPVTREGTIIGVLAITDPHVPGPIKNSMRTLNESLAVPANTSIRTALKAFSGDSTGYRLVVTDGVATGIVTRSDFQKLPVRILAYTVVAALEALLMQVIEEHTYNDEWIALFADEVTGLDGFAMQYAVKGTGEAAIEKLMVNQRAYSSRGVVPPLLEIADFAQKWYAVHRLLELGPEFGNDMARIQRYLRNPIALNGNYVASDWQVERLHKLLQICEKWTNRLAQGPTNEVGENTATILQFPTK